MKNIVRVIIPDSHGAHIAIEARDALVRDIKRLAPDEIVWLGDHLDCGGTFNSHQRNYTKEMTESYADDVDACNEFLDLVSKAAPKASQDYLEGNHEAHVERWAARNMHSKKDADMLLERIGPAKVLDLKRRGVRYFRCSEMYQGLSIPGTIRKGKVFFTHGISFSRNAAQVHLDRFGASVVFGHCHRSMGVIERTVTSSGHGAWCPGTLAKLQPLYRHTAPTTWTWGFGVQFVAPSGNFVHVNVPIFAGGKSMLAEMTRRVA